MADNQGLRIRVDRVAMRVVQRRVGKAKRSGKGQYRERGRWGRRFDGWKG
jgi:hypothetical protein